MTVQVKIDPTTGLTKCGNSVDREKAIQLLFSVVHTSGPQGWGLGIPNVLRNADQLLMHSVMNHKKIEASYFPHAYWSVDNRPKGTKQIVDSGSFSLMYGSGKKIIDKMGVDKTIDEYVDYYVDFVNNHFKDRCKTNNTPWFVEMDLSPTIGMEKYRKIRDRLLNSCPDRDFIGVWHQEDGVKAIDELCEHYDYIAISAAMNWKLPALNALYYINEKYPDKCIHILGRSQLDNMTPLGHHKLADTCDSTSWTVPKRFGCHNENVKILAKKIQPIIEEHLMRYIRMGSNSPNSKYGWTETNREAEVPVLFKIWELWMSYMKAGEQKHWDKGHIRNIIRKALSGEVDTITESDLGEFLWKPVHAPLVFESNDKTKPDKILDWRVPEGYENIVNRKFYEAKPLMM